MKQYSSNDTWILIFKKGEPLISTLTDFCRQQNISAGFFHGLGGALDVELGYYHLDRGKYEFRKLDEVLEIASLHGNVALKEGLPFIHAHGVFSDSSLKTHAGHVNELTVGGTCELRLQVFDTPWQRLPDDETGLSLIDFDADK